MLQEVNRDQQMKIATALTVALLNAAAIVAWADDQKCVDELRNIGIQQLTSIACDSLMLGKNILEGKPGTVPEKIYHFGKKENLIQDAKEHNVPKEVWDNVIMSPKGRYKLSSLRNGLYGTHFISTNDYYGDPYGWLMEVHIKSSCREPSKVATLEQLDGDRRFSKWIAKKQGLPYDLSQFKKDCSFTDDKERVYALKVLEPCTKIAEAFLADHDIKIIQDHVISRSFYIRDRDCISDIKSEPADLLQIYADTPALWITECDTSEYANANSHIAKQALQIAADEATSIDATLIEKLRLNSKLLRDSKLKDEFEMLSNRFQSGDLSEWRRSFKEKFY